VLWKNAETLGIDLADADAIVISYGHYDHTGGLPGVLELTRKATVYLHLDAAKARFSEKSDNTRMIGMSASARRKILTLDKAGKVIWTERPTEVLPKLFTTGRIPRNNDFEDIGGAFYADKACRTKHGFFNRPS